METSCETHPAPQDSSGCAPHITRSAAPSRDGVSKRKRRSDAKVSTVHIDRCGNGAGPGILDAGGADPVGILFRLDGQRRDPRGGSRRVLRVLRRPLRRIHGGRTPLASAAAGRSLGARDPECDGRPQLPRLQRRDGIATGQRRLPEDDYLDAGSAPGHASAGSDLAASGRVRRRIGQPGRGKRTAVRRGNRDNRGRRELSARPIRLSGTRRALCRGCRVSLVGQLRAARPARRIRVGARSHRRIRRRSRARHDCGIIIRRVERRPASGVTRQRGTLSSSHHSEWTAHVPLAHARGSGSAGRPVRDRARLPRSPAGVGVHAIAHARSGAERTPDRVRSDSRRTARPVGASRRRPGASRSAAHAVRERRLCPSAADDRDQPGRRLGVRRSQLRERPDRGTVRGGALRRIRS